MLTLGLTPVLAAQLDDPYGLSEMHTWLGSWQVRAQQLGTRRDPRQPCSRPVRASASRAGGPRTSSSTGAAAVRLRCDRWWTPAWSSCSAGRRRTRSSRCCRDGSSTSGCTSVWTTRQCAWDDDHAGSGHRSAGTDLGSLRIYARAGVSHFVVDGPTLQATGRTTAQGVWVDDSDVAAFARDLEVTYRVWSPRAGYPGRSLVPRLPHLRPLVGLPRVPCDQQAHAARTRRLRTHPERACGSGEGRRGLRRHGGASAHRSTPSRDGRARPGRGCVRHRAVRALVARGSAFLAAVLRRLPHAGVRVTTLQGAIGRRFGGRSRRPARRVVGVGQGLAGVAGAGGRAISPRRMPTVSHRLLDVMAKRGQRTTCWPVTAPPTSWLATRCSRWQRLDVHGGQGLRGAVRTRARGCAMPRRGQRWPPRSSGTVRHCRSTASRRNNGRRTDRSRHLDVRLIARR